MRRSCEAIGGGGPDDGFPDTQELPTPALVHIGVQRPQCPLMGWTDRAPRRTLRFWVQTTEGA